VEREEAQGVEVFSDPDATLPAGALQEGTPGRETLTGDNFGWAQTLRRSATVSAHAGSYQRWKPPIPGCGFRVLSCRRWTATMCS
jgi:hypothetical protein